MLRRMYQICHLFLYVMLVLYFIMIMALVLKLCVDFMAYRAEKLADEKHQKRVELFSTAFLTVLYLLCFFCLGMLTF